MLLTELLTPDRVRVPITASDRTGVLQELVRFLVERSGGDYHEALRAVEEREQVLSTGIGFGVAIPHGRTPAIPELSMVAGITSKPVPFDAVDGEPVRLFFLIVGPEAAAGQHVKVLSRIARLVRREPLRQRLMEAATPADFYHALADAEAH
ncbi:MAG TPA: PTS sugar transporter subunit IIA [Gemmatimonadales bacterium]|nr:PTS sugar transporter subunit IIA [Gemmatimonadales bacterium]